MLYASLNVRSYVLDKLCCHVRLTANANKLVKKLNPDFLNIFSELNWDAN